MEAFKCEGRSGTIAEQALDARAVITLDADGGIDAEAAGSLPGEHTLGIDLIEQAVRAEVSENAALKQNTLESDPITASSRCVGRPKVNDRFRVVYFLP